MKLELFDSHEQRDFIEIESNPQDLDIESEDFSFGDIIHVSCNFSRDMDMVRLHGEVRSCVIVQCVRCLDGFKQDIIGDFSLVARRLRKGESVPDYSDEESKEDESRLIYVEHDTNAIDITDFVRDALILSIPLKPVCRENCKGLCSVCGHNLNEGECGCKRERNDPRWKELSGLFNS